MSTWSAYGQVIWQGRWWLGATVLLFAAGALLGYALAASNPDEVMARLEPLLAQLQQVGERVTRAETPLGRAMPIFLNNLRSIIFMMAGGLLFGIVPFAGTLVNGLIVGLVVGLGERVSPVALTPVTLALALAPHGIVELPALWLGGAWGLKLGLAWLLPPAAGHRMEVFVQTAREAARIFLLVVLLLFIAALIEGNLTLLLVRGIRAGVWPAA